MVVIISLGGFVADQLQYNLVGAQYLIELLYDKNKYLLIFMLYIIVSQIEMLICFETNKSTLSNK